MIVEEFSMKIKLKQKVLEYYFSIMTVVFFVCLSNTPADALDSLTVFNKNSKKVAYRNPKIKSQSMLMPLKNPSIIQAIKVGVIGDTGTFRIRLVRNRNNDLYPFRGEDLIEPVKCVKNAKGNQYITYNLEKSIYVSERSVFVIIDSLSANMFLLTDEKKKKPLCVTKDNQKIFFQSMLLGDNEWKTGYYGYDIMLYLDREEGDVKNSFEKQSVEIAKDDTLFANSIALQDIDSDGYTDILSSGKLLKNNGEFEFTDISQQMGINSSPQYNAFIDINSDGNYEILCLNDKQSENNNFLYRKNGSQYVSDEISTLPKFHRIINASVVDINGDVYPDLIVYFEDESSKIILNAYINDGQSQFKESNLYKEEVTAEHNYTFLSIDINNDRRNDIVYSYPQGLKILKNNGNKFLDITTEIISEEIQDKLKNYKDIYLRSNDYNSDGNFDVIISGTPRTKSVSDYNNSLIMLKNLGIEKQYSFMIDCNYDSLVTPNFNGSTIFSDFNNDGKEDLLLMPGCECYYPVLYLQQTSGTFLPISHTTNFYNTTLSSDALAADLNNDGLNDLICNEDGLLRVYKNELNNKGQNVKIKYVQSGLQNKVYNYEAVVYKEDKISRYSFYPQVGKLIHSAPEITISVANNEAIDSIIVYDKIDNKIVSKKTQVNDEKVIIINDVESTRNMLSNIVSNHQATPNPFSETVKISFDLNVSTNINVSIYSVAGNKLAELYDGYCNAGFHSYQWNSSTLSSISGSNTYLYKIIVDNQEYVGQLIRIN